MLRGGAGNDRLNGQGGNDSVAGGPGDDILNAQAGNDTVSGGPGDDTLLGRGGDDSIDGGPDIDEVVFEQSAAGVVVDLAAGTAVGEGADSVTTIENAIGSDFIDVLRGTAVRNVFFGGLSQGHLPGPGRQ